MAYCKVLFGSIVVVAFLGLSLSSKFFFEDIGYDSGHLLYYRNRRRYAARYFDINSSDGTNSLTHALLSVITGKTRYSWL